MSVIQIDSVDNPKTRTIVQVTGTYVVNKLDSIIDCQGVTTVILPESPQVGETHEILASGGVVTLDGNGHAITGVLALLDQGLGVILSFSSSDTWIASGTGGNGGGSIGNLIEPDIAALSGVIIAPLSTGTVAFVQTVRSWYTLDKESTETLDGIVVVATEDGTGRWLRNPNDTHQSWLVASAWFIDANTGDDENEGQTLELPLKTVAEMTRRLGPRAQLRPPVDADAASRLLTINILSNIPGDDPFNADWILTQDVTVWVKGGVETVEHSSTFTGVVAQDPDTNQSYELTDSSLESPTSWTAWLNKRVRITSGPRANAFMWVAKDLGAKTFRPSNPGTVEALTSTAGPQGISGSTDVTPVVPQVGDAYAVETLFRLPIGYFNVELATCSDTELFWLPSIWFGELNLSMPTALPGSIFLKCSGAHAGGLSTYSCVIAESDGCVVAADQCRSLNDNWPSGFLAQSGFTSRMAGMTRGLIAGTPGGTVGLTRDHLSQGAFATGNLVIANAAFFDVLSDGRNTGGHAIVVANGGIQGYDAHTGLNFQNGRLNICPYHPQAIEVRIWGKDNSGTGMFVPNGGSVVYSCQTDKLTVTGADGDFRLGSEAGGDVRNFDDATATFTDQFPPTWANLAAAFGVGLGEGAFCQSARIQRQV